MHISIHKYHDDVIWKMKEKRGEKEDVAKNGAKRWNN